MKLYKREIRAYRRPTYDMGCCYGGGALTEWQAEENEAEIAEKWKNDFDVVIQERFIPVND